MAVVNNVKKEWLDGKARMTLSGIAYVMALFATEQIACNQTHTKEEFNIHVVNQRYDIVLPENEGLNKNTIKAPY
jgi:hypothetical protein